MCSKCRILSPLVASHYRNEKRKNRKKQKEVKSINGGFAKFGSLKYSAAYLIPLTEFQLSAVRSFMYVGRKVGFYFLGPTRYFMNYT